MLQVGQELWYVPADRRYRDHSRAVRVDKIGRKWADLDPRYVGRVSIETLWIDGGTHSSPGRCWLSKQAWVDDVRRTELWVELKNSLGYVPPDHVNIEMIETIKRMIFR